MPTTETFLPANRSAMRCKKGNVNWQTGQEILKKAATTGPRARRESSEYSFPSSDFSEKRGAVRPASIVVKGSSSPNLRAKLCHNVMPLFYRKRRRECRRGKQRPTQKMRPLLPRIPKRSGPLAKFTLRFEWGIAGL